MRISFSVLKINTGCSQLLSWIWIGCLFLMLSMPVMAGTVSDDKGNAEVRKNLEELVIARIAFYASHFPDMDFVVLDSAGDAEKNMHALYQILGEDPVPLDYAHPEALRHSLLLSTYIRIQFLLDTDVGSATLFEPGKGALARRKQVCIVTFNPWAIAKNDKAATRYLLDLPLKEFNQIPRSHYLARKSHLLFVLDHEIYHCLDASMNGPIPISKQAHWGDYQMIRNESGADAFAILMQMASHGRVTAYARTLKLIRGLTLLGGDPGHYTYPAINAALQVDAHRLRLNDVRHVVQLATQIRNDIVGSYDDYLQYAIAAEHAMVKMGVLVSVPQFAKSHADPALVEKLIAQTREAYRELTGHELPVKMHRRNK